MTLEQLDADYSLTHQLTFVAGPGGLPMIEINNPLAKATISVYGGQVLSFQPVGAADLLFLSEQAYYAEGKAIKGGVPVCWPWFGADPENKGRAAHGFVRNRMWNVNSTETLEDGETKVVLGLSDSEATREIWPYGFEMAIAITVGTTLRLQLMTRNTGDQPFALTQALHTYFSVGEIGQVEVLGLEGTRYLDKAKGSGGGEKSQLDAVTVAAEVDRIYLNVPSELAIVDASLGRRINITSSGSKTAVVWNPWAEIAAASGDLADDSYQKFICVETTNAATDVVEVPVGGDACLVATYGIG
ncbi:MAG: D-hexose-6-phosphate mutarotase [Synechococcales cyanobacterium CRU_2_2]|nr:D-hexose-6-phosphate mutarotase [Synechococcales cyanobacterium CRU_2_2]